MVPRKSWVLENFSSISESRRRFYRVSEARLFLVWFRNRLSLGLGFSNKGLGFYHSSPRIMNAHLNPHESQTTDHLDQVQEKPLATSSAIHVHEGELSLYSESPGSMDQSPATCHEDHWLLVVFPWEWCYFDCYFGNPLTASLTGTG